MTSSKLLLVLMAAASSLAAPQINERQVVDNVITQLQPAILQALSQANLGSSSSGSRFGGASSGSQFAGASGSRFAGASGSRFSGSTGATRGSFSSSPSSSASISSLTSSVVSSLSPSIEAAVAQALAGSRRSGSSFRGGSSSRAGIGATGGTSAEPDYGPAQYDYSYKVADDETQSYLAKQESRNGDDVTGTYNYVDSTGSLVTVNYQAGAEGYSETRDVEKGAVQLREIPGGWTGPLAGVDDVETSVSSVSATKNTNRGLSQSDLIAQILGALQPQISSAVQSAISSSSAGSASRTSSLGQTTSYRPISFGVGQSSGATTRRAGSSFSSGQGSSFSSGQGSGFSSGQRTGFSSGQGNIVNSVISSLSPRIASAVNSAISSSRTVSVPRARASTRQAASSGGSLGGLFGVSGENSVKIETPEFQIQY